ncbi:hypothetical protein LWC33_31280 [Pseudonocardia sp. RS11V-5]|nr:hypothetical protein [Pseudonocardia terrae]MCE3555914.1 hypothetical protein [Pseudonocardia terrae]
MGSKSGSRTTLSRWGARDRSAPGAPVTVDITSNSRSGATAAKPVAVGETSSSRAIAAVAAVACSASTV